MVSAVARDALRCAIVGVNPARAHRYRDVQHDERLRWSRGDDGVDDVSHPVGMAGRQLE